jgi:hypothetical protein
MVRQFVLTLRGIDAPHPFILPSFQQLAVRHVPQPAHE